MWEAWPAADKRSGILWSGGRSTASASERQSGTAARRLSWEMAGKKLFYIGEDRRRNGVGIILNDDKKKGVL